MRKLFLLSVLLLLNGLVNAQPHPGGEYFVDNCQCSSYKVTFPNPNISITYTTDSLKRILVSETIGWAASTRIDSFYYNKKGQLSAKKAFAIEDGSFKCFEQEEYSYNEQGKLIQVKNINHHGLVRNIETFNWDSQNRPSLFVNSYYRSNIVTEQYKLSFKFIGDSISLLEYRGENLRSTSKRILNNKGQIIKEYVEKKPTGAKVTYDYKYTEQGLLKSIHKVKVIGGDISSFETYPYINLLDSSRKISYSYDYKGRVSYLKIFENINLDKVLIYQYIYTD